MGMPATGPLANELTRPVEEEIPEQRIATLRPGAAAPLPADQVWGLLRPFSGRARGILIGLLRGDSAAMAAAAQGTTAETVRVWSRKSPEFAAAVATAREWGFATVYEAELYRIALDTEHRGQIRALEMVVKSRDSAYRDKAQLQIEVIRAAGEAEQRMVGGWRTVSQPEDDPET